MIKSILVPVDGSTSSRVAVDYAVDFGLLYGAEVCGLNIVDIRSLEGPFLSDISASLGFAPFQNYLPKFQQVLEERSDSILKGFEEAVSATGLQYRCKKLTGIVPSVISEEARKFDLVVIAQRGEHEPWSTGLLGSTTESVVRRAPRPVLVTPIRFRKINKIIVAYDGEVESSNALKSACEIFLNDSYTLTVVVVADDPVRKERLSAEVREYAEPYHREFDIVVLSGDAGKSVLSFAEDNGYDLIVMGVFSHSRLHDLILGSTAAYILRKAEIPVLLNR